MWSNSPTLRLVLEPLPSTKAAAEAVYASSPARKAADATSGGELSVAMSSATSAATVAASKTPSGPMPSGHSTTATPTNPPTSRLLVLLVLLVMVSPPLELAPPSETVPVLLGRRQVVEDP